MLQLAREMDEMLARKSVKLLVCVLCTDREKAWQEMRDQEVMQDYRIFCFPCSNAIYLFNVEHKMNPDASCLDPSLTD